MEATPQTDAPEIGLVGRMARVFYAPGETFASLARKQSTADWLVPMIIGSILAVFIAQQIIPIAMMASPEMRDMPTEQREMVEKMMGGEEGAVMIGMVTAPISTFVTLFAAAALLLLLVKLLGGEGTYGQVRLHFWWLASRCSKLVLHRGGMG